MSGRLRHWPLAAAHVVLPLAAFALARLHPDWPTRNVFRVVLFGEAAMLCVWASLSVQPAVRRAAICVAGLTALWILLRSVDWREPSQKLTECLFFPSALTVALTLAIKSSPALNDDDYAGRWQFSVRQLFIITSTVAVLIVLVQNFWRSSLIVNPRLVASEGSQICMVLTSWAALPWRWRKWRIAAAAVLVCAVGIVVQSFLSESWFWDALKNVRRASAAQLWEDLISVPFVTLIESLFVAVTVTVFFGRRPKRMMVPSAR
ncbi:MAG TPA: hypothetical protein VFI31_06060 [Pirellulales bacterium]|nr:hypothetical protein [Pirellulales bacterium]